MVAEGWTWHYRQYSKDKALAAAEAKARETKAGLCADARPAPPQGVHK
jgi:endonuclease YncB( thermonuclease family)